MQVIITFDNRGVSEAVLLPGPAPGRVVHCPHEPSRVERPDRFPDAEVLRCKRRPETGRIKRRPAHLAGDKVQSA